MSEINIRISIQQHDADKRAKLLKAFKAARTVQRKAVKQAFEEKHAQARSLDPDAPYPGTAPAPTHISLAMAKNLLKFMGDHCDEEVIERFRTALNEYEAFSSLDSVSQDGDVIELNFLSGEGHDFAEEIMPIFHHAGFGAISGKVFCYDWDEGTLYWYEDNELCSDDYDFWSEEE